MRTELAPFLNQRLSFKATFVRMGKCVSKRNMALLVNVHAPEMEDVCDHIWVCLPKKVGRLKLAEGDMLSFTAEVRLYTRGLYGPAEKPAEQDFGLFALDDLAKLKPPRKTVLFPGLRVKTERHVVVKGRIVTETHFATTVYGSSEKTETWMCRLENGALEPFELGEIIVLAATDG